MVIFKGSEKLNLMAISKKIIKYLEDNKCKYAVIEHKTVFTAWDKAQTEHAKPQEVAKTLVVKTDNDYILALIPSNRKLDKVKLLKIVNAARKKKGVKTIKKIELAKEAWMKKSLPGKIGAVPPFGKMLKLDVYVDNLLLKNKKIYIGTGEYTTSFLVSTSQYLKIEEPVKGSFSIKK
jgi:Ala-tRNA(Pro) deacylase